MSDLLKLLRQKEQRGSKPRCHFLTHGTADQVAARLTELITPWGLVSRPDRWMPDGFRVTQEAQLHRAPRLLDPAICKQLGAWWLPFDQQNARTPNFDIAATCTVEGKSGIVLVEAKAHYKELDKESVGRAREVRKPTRSALTETQEERNKSHETIGAAIESARLGIAAATKCDWHIARDTHYQMSNRFAWTWKLATLGTPVILVYLGFLGCSDMSKNGEQPFPDHSSWERLVLSHSAPLFPPEVWNRRWALNGVPFIPIIRSMHQLLEPATSA